MSDTEGNDEPVILIVIAVMLWIALSEQQNTLEELGQPTKASTLSRTSSRCKYRTCWKMHFA